MQVLVHVCMCCVWDMVKRLCATSVVCYHPIHIPQLSDLSSQPLPDSSSIPDSPGGRGSNPCPSSVVLTTSKKWRSKRVKFFYFLARVRPVSRALMVRMYMHVHAVATVCDVCRAKHDETL